MLRALDSSSSTMPMGLGQQAPVCTEPASSSVDWRVEHLLRGPEGVTHSLPYPSHCDWL